MGRAERVAVENQASPAAPREASPVVHIRADGLPSEDGEVDHPLVNRASPAVDQALETGVVVDQVNQGRAAQVQARPVIGVETDGILTSECKYTSCALKKFLKRYKFP